MPQLIFQTIVVSSALTMPPKKKKTMAPPIIIRHDVNKPGHMARFQKALAIIQQPQ